MTESDSVAWVNEHAPQYNVGDATRLSGPITFLTASRASGAVPKLLCTVPVVFRRNIDLAS
jgi:hypothetical protein